MAIFPVETRYIIRKACISNLSAIHHSSPSPPLSTKRKKGRERKGERDRERIYSIYKAAGLKKGEGMKEKGDKRSEGGGCLFCANAAGSFLFERCRMGY